MNAHQRRKARRAGTHYRCDNCMRIRRMPYYALTGCEVCWRETHSFKQPLIIPPPIESPTRTGCR